MAEGANIHERLLAAARSDDEEMLLEVLDAPNLNINFQNGMGNTALHLAALHGSINVLEHILSHKDCDVDPINFIEKVTPLHLAIRIDDKEIRIFVVRSLLDAGADISIKDKHGQTAANLAERHPEVLKLFATVQAEKGISKDDVADEDDDGGASASGSDSE